MVFVLAPVAQLDRAPDFESVGRGFESLRARHHHSRGLSEMPLDPFCVSGPGPVRLRICLWDMGKLGWILGVALAHRIHPDCITWGVISRSLSRYMTYAPLQPCSIVMRKWTIGMYVTI